MQRRRQASLAAAVAARPGGCRPSDWRCSSLFDALRARRRALLLPRPDPGQEICRADRRRRRLVRHRPLDPPLRPGRLADRAVAASPTARTRSMPARGDELRELDGQLLLPLGRGDDAEIGGAVSPRPRPPRPTAASPRPRRSTGAASPLDPGDFGRRLQPRQLPERRAAGATKRRSTYRAGAQARPGLRRGLVQLRRPAARARPAPTRPAASAARRSRSIPTMPTRSTISPRSNMTPAISATRAALVAALSRARPASRTGHARAARGIAFCRPRRSAHARRLSDAVATDFLFDGPDDARDHDAARPRRRRADGFARR